MAFVFAFSHYVLMFFAVLLRIYGSAYVDATSSHYTPGLRYNLSSLQEAFTVFNVEVCCHIWNWAYTTVGQASSGRAIQSKVHALSAYCVAGTVIDLWY